jgi:hypothetical protein
MKTPSIKVIEGKAYLITSRHDDQQARPVLERNELDEDTVERLFVELSTARRVVYGLAGHWKKGGR